MTKRNQSDPFTTRCVSLISGAVAVFAMLAMTTVQGAEWRIEPLIRAAANFDDNATLTVRTDEEEEISGYIIDARARFAYASQTTDFFVTPILRSRDYGDPRFDADEQFLRSELEHNTQKNNFRIRANYDREAVRTAERADVDLDVEDPDDIRDEETAQVRIRGRRERVEVLPSWTYRFSDVSSLSARLAYRDIQYDENFAGVLEDYTNGRATVSYQRRWSARYTAIVNGSYRRFEPEGREAGTGAGVTAGFAGSLSENTRVRLLVGLEETEIEPGGSSLDWVANVSLVRRLQTITLLAQYRRGIAGGGSGTLSSRDEINLNLTRRLNDRISAGLGVRAYATNALEGDVVNFDERDYVQMRAQFIWNLTRTWFIDVNYRYTFLNRQIIGESANSNDVTIWLSWQPTGISR
jgi:hypothetical protein